MKLSISVRYALRALAYVRGQREKPVSVRDIARRLDIPCNYLEQLFARLRQGGIVSSARGAHGGYTLSRPAGEITVNDVIDALGDSIVFGDCQTPKGCPQASTCPTFELWRRVKGSVDEILCSTTLEDIGAER